MFTFDWNQSLVDFIRVAIAFVLALPIAWERIHSRRRIGLRTFPIVAIASCGYILIIRALPNITPEAEARALQGLLSGIGFIGGGAILKKGLDVRGLATAASIWNTGAIGAAVAFGREEIAIILSLINFLMLYFLTPLAREFKGIDETSPQDSDEDEEV
jgi:putative Mg2+ transporter-C (MgtC) family protein